MAVENILDENKAYLLFRGTKTKEGIVSSSYNVFNSRASHVGFLFFVNEKWVVYHIVENSSENSA